MTKEQLMEINVSKLMEMLHDTTDQEQRDLIEQAIAEKQEQA
jgi:hypothetical protein